MRNSSVMYGIVAAIILTSFLAVVIPAHAFPDHEGPRPIPGEMFPHPDKPVPPATVKIDQSDDIAK